MTTILVVDDEAPLLRALLINLKARGYVVDGAASGRAALDRFARVRPGLVILDLGLPDLDGVEVLDGIRGWSQVPVLVLSARSTSEEKVRALEHGADDYITKPFDMAELVARIRAVTRRYELQSQHLKTPIITTDSFEIDRSRAIVTRHGQQVHLTPTEWHILDTLATHFGKLVSQQQLLSAVWGPGYEKQTHYLRVHVAALRGKLEPEPSHPRHLITEPGLGYRLV
ncbi:MAG: response regulator transcription factor [Candidatus Nanopelagicales bacterium]